VKDTVPGIDYRFSDPGLLEEALTHRSASPRNYERLEFLGDSILSLVVSQQLFERFPQANEGDLSRMRARIVRGRTLAEVASKLGLGQQIILGQGEMKSGGIRRSSILSDTLESLFGAILLDGGFAACQTVISNLFEPLIEALPAADTLKDAKTRLQEWMQARGRALPIYRLVREDGADHAKNFQVDCQLDGDTRVMTAVACNRRQAEQAAAALWLELLESRVSTP